MNIKSIRNLTMSAAAALGMFAITAPAQATVINFDSLSNNTVVTNQFAAQGITFSSRCV